MVEQPHPHTVLVRMLDEAHTLPPWLVPRWAQRHARQLGALDATIWLHDYDQRTLAPLTDDTVGRLVTTAVPVDDSLPGRAYTLAEQTEDAADGDPHRLFTPLLDGAERVGVLELLLPEIDDDVRLLASRMAAITTALLLSKGMHTDVYFQARRSRPMTLAAEMQWHLLPPLTVMDPRVSIAGVLEPAYEVGGDAFDYAINHETAHLAIFDAMGHGLDASVMSTVAVSAYRHARRNDIPIADMYTLVDAAFAGEFGAERFVTAQLATLHLPTGELSFVNAGHPAPLLVREREVVGTITAPATLPIGLGGPAPAIAVEQLRPGDRLALYSDGVVDARRTSEPLGEAGLVRIVEEQLATELPLPELLRRINQRLLRWRNDRVDDDSTLMIVEWRSPQLPDY